MFSFRNSKLPFNRELRSSLQSIRGVGWFISCFVTFKFGFSYPFFFGNMNFYQFLLLSFLLKSLVGRFYHMERFTFARIHMLIKLGAFRGLRHRDFLPVRGQRTRTNAGVRKAYRFFVRKF